MPNSPLNFSSVVRAAPWRVASLVLATMLVWAVHYDRWTVAQWRLPTDYSGDAHEILARLQAAAEGDTIPLKQQVITRLGAPFGAYWNAYPTPDKPLMLALGAVARQIGLFAAANLGLLLAQVSAALAFYFSARWLRCRWEWAWTGALLFAYTYHTFHRGLAHFSFVFTWTVPLGLLAVALIAQSRRLQWRSSGMVVCVVAALGLGTGNPYNLLFWGQLLVWALIIQAGGPRRRENLGIGLATGALALLAFLLSNAELWLHTLEPEGLPLLSRNYGGTERYALKPVEMLIPPQYHRWDLLAFFGQRYDRWSDWRGEAFLPYLGLVGVAGLAWLGVVTGRRLLQRRGLPGQALVGGWLLAYASVGGLTNVLAFFAGFQVFRATNRVATFVSALVLGFLVVRLSRWTASWPAPLRLTAALAVAALGVLDQLPRKPGPAGAERIAAEVASDAALGRELEDALPRGAMVFQLPVLGFPEVKPPHRLADYEHFRPYLSTRDLRFSYGAAKFRARSRWQRDLEPLATAELVRRLEAYGFAALYVNRKGYEDRAERLLSELASLGYDRRVQGRLGNQVVIFLRPEPSPKWPLGRTLTYGRGWHPTAESGVRWANDDAALSYFNPYREPLLVDLRFSLVGVSPRTVWLEHEGRPVGRIPIGPQPVDLALGRFALPPGINRFKFRSAEPPLRLSAGRYQLRSLGVREVALEFIAVPPSAGPSPPAEGSAPRFNP